MARFIGPYDHGWGWELKRHEREYIKAVAARRHAASKSRHLDSGGSRKLAELVGTAAEVAVCLHYGVDYREHVLALETRPGPIPDVEVGDWKISVKARERHGPDVDLIVHEHDTDNDLYMLTTVVLEDAIVSLRGFVTRRKLLTYEPEPWKWTTDRPGARRESLRRYVPSADLTPCKPPHLTPYKPPRTTSTEERDELRARTR